MRAFEFIRTDVGIGHLPVKLIGAVPGFLSTGNGPTHQAIEDIALMRGIPAMQIFCPSDSQELVEGLEQMIGSPHPCYVRFNSRAPVVEHTTRVRIGAAEVLTDGFDVTILTYGFLLEQAVIATYLLEKEGISVRLINLRTLSPIDARCILEAARETELLVTLEDHFLIGGLYSIVCELLTHYRVPSPVYPLALMNRWFLPGLLEEVLATEGFTGEMIAERIHTRLMELRSSPWSVFVDKTISTSSVPAN